MKKTIITILAGLIAASGFAQTAGDALRFSENNYEGTARTTAMGNAFTALGGDLGSVGLNPAGSAVAPYSQITFTPSLTFAASTTQGVMPPYSSGSSLPYFERQMKSNATRFAMPNIGVMLNFDTHRTSGVKNLTIGFVVNKTAGWDEDMFANGTNNNTSFMGAMAYDATINGYLDSELGASDAFDYMPWKPAVGYNSGMISTFGGHNNQYVGASEVIYENGDIAIGGPLEQSYGRRVSGTKYDGVINFAANVSDFIYIGANIGITSLDYSYREYFKEMAINPENFEIGLDDGSTIYFNDMRYKYDYSASGMGWYGKIGVIVTPGAGFRFGAAIQTPTLNRITETWSESGETTYTDSRYNASETSPRGEGGYMMISPFRANFGLAYTVGQFGVVSADYEVCDYSTMKYKTSGYDREYFEDVNADIREFYRTSHILRLGAEIKPVSGFAVRAGYNLATSPENYENAPKYSYQNISFGLGYSSKKSFFADLAVRKTILPDEYFMPYEDYLYDSEDNIIEYAPEILNQKSLWKVMLTLGWRF